MLLLLISFLAGVLTVLAPCILPVLPIIIGGSVQGGQKRNPYIITASLAIAVVVFTLALKFSTAFINIPPTVWGAISGVILIGFGLISVFPETWDAISLKLGLSNKSEQLLANSRTRKTRWGDILIGASLGPVFSSCSPTYFLILATVLPRDFATGLLYLVAYALGLSLVLLLISLLGQRFIQRAKFAANPRGWFKRGLGVLFILVGIFILTGADKRLQTLLLEKGYFNITNLEQTLLQSTEKKMTGGTTDTNGATANQLFPQYREIAKPSGFVNTSNVTLGELVGKKVILVDFMTYSCINCIRTFPYLNAWYDKYKDQGLEIVGIHTPEFAFEKKLENVQAAMKRYGIEFPVVLDNDYGTWNAYGNNYWPRKYLIDINGKVVYDHIGEGGYTETEEKIQELLREKMAQEHQAVMMVSTSTVAIEEQSGYIKGQSPEVYFGADRNEYLSNGKRNTLGLQQLQAPTQAGLNNLVLTGSWNIAREHAENKSPSAKIIYRYNARNVFFVAASQAPLKVKILRDGKPLPREAAGADIQFEGTDSYVLIDTERLYHLIRDPADMGEHGLEIQIPAGGLNAYTFTFG
ncbi:redoxin family protein [Patescibacteria group bacterium]|nr:redoxin family protein [Patescibacteria group bacterium]